MKGLGDLVYTKLQWATRGGAVGKKKTSLRIRVAATELVAKTGGKKGISGKRKLSMGGRKKRSLGTLFTSTASETHFLQRGG